MRHTILHSSRRIRMRALRYSSSSLSLSSLSSPSPSRHSPASCTTSITNSGADESNTLLPRRNEFARRRALYFSSSGSHSDTGNWTLEHLANGKTQREQQQCRASHQARSKRFFVPSSAVRWLTDPLDCTNTNRRYSDSGSLLSALSFIRTEKQKRPTHRWYSAKPANGTDKTKTIDLVSPTYLVSRTTQIASRVRPIKTSKMTLVTTSTDDNKNVHENVHEKENENENKNENNQPDVTASDSFKTRDANVGSNNDNVNENDSDSETEAGWKRVRTIKVPEYGPDADRAVRSLQNARKERARVKTSINVQRALYGNMLICAAKLGAWLSSGSSSMMAEFVHSVVDCGNQALLLIGLRGTRNAADKRHPYGYGKSVYFWALVSALGTFFMGAGLSMSHSIQTLFNPTLVENINNEVWFVLAMSFSIDGYVLYKTVGEMEEARPKSMPMLKYIAKLRDPATLAVLLEDGAACLGIVIAIAGIAASHATSNPIYDGVAGVGISCLLGAVGLTLASVNHSFLIGQGVEREMLEGIEKIIRNRRSIENVSGIQSQWTGPETFSFKAEVDFDGTYLSALLMPRYRAEFINAGDNLDEELGVLLSWYAEDVIRAVEREVRHIEAMIRQQYPGAEYIELEPMSKFVDRFAIDDSFEEKLLMIEKKELKRWVRVLYENKEENAWRAVDATVGSSTVSSTNAVSGAVPSDTMAGSGIDSGDSKILK